MTKNKYVDIQKLIHNKTNMSKEQRNPALTEAVDKLAKSIAPVDVELFRALVALPNSPDIHPEVLALKLKYGADRVSHVSDLIEKTRVSLGVDYDTLREAVSERLTN